VTFHLSIHHLIANMFSSEHNSLSLHDALPISSQICGVPVAEIEAFAKLVGETKRTFFRLGYGFTRSRNGATQMHAASCIPAVTRSEEHTSELQSRFDLVCRLLLEKKKNKTHQE